MENALHGSRRSMRCASEVTGRPARRHAPPQALDLRARRHLRQARRSATHPGGRRRALPAFRMPSERAGRHGLPVEPKPLEGALWGRELHGHGRRKVPASDARATPACRGQGAPPRRCLAHVSCVMVEGGSSMPRLQLSLKRRTQEVGRSRSHLPEGRMRPARTQREFGRRPRMPDPPVRRPPYIEAAITAAAFIFLLYLVLGGA